MIPVRLGGKLHWFTKESLLDELQYRAYSYNREQAPHITPEKWAKVFPKAVEFEKRRIAEVCA